MHIMLAWNMVTFIAFYTHEFAFMHYPKHIFVTRSCNKHRYSPLIQSIDNETSGFSSHFLINFLVVVIFKKC